MVNKNSVSRRFSAENRALKSTSPSPKAVSLSEQFKKMLRHPLILGLSILLGIGLALIASMMATPKYSSTSTVMVYALSQDPNAQATNQNKVEIDTEASVASSREVAEAAAEKIDSNDKDLASKLRRNVEVAAHSGTAILDITATAETAEKAQEYTNAVAESYLQVREDNMKEQVKTTAATIQKNLDGVSRDDNATRQALQERLAQVESTSTTAGRVVTEGQLPSDSGNLSWWKYALVGAIAGALVGLLLSYFMDNRSRQVSYLDRAEDALNSETTLIRKGRGVEDTKILLRRLGYNSAAHSASDLKGIVVYSPVQKDADEMTSYLSQALPNKKFKFVDFLDTKSAPAQHLAAVEERPTIATAPADSSLADVLTETDRLGACLVAISSDSAIADLEDISYAAETSDGIVEYVYLEK